MTRPPRLSVELDRPLNVRARRAAVLEDRQTADIMRDAIAAVVDKTEDIEATEPPGDPVNYGFNIPAELRTAVRLAAVDNELTVSDIVRHALVTYLDKNHPAKK